MCASNGYATLPTVRVSITPRAPGAAQATQLTLTATHGPPLHQRARHPSKELSEGAPQLEPQEEEGAEQLQEHDEHGSISQQAARPCASQRSPGRTRALQHGEGPTSESMVQVGERDWGRKSRSCHRS